MMTNLKAVLEEAKTKALTIEEKRRIATYVLDVALDLREYETVQAALNYLSVLKSENKLHLLS